MVRVKGYCKKMIDDSECLQAKEKEEARLEEEKEKEKEEKKDEEEKKPGFDGTWYTDINEEWVHLRNEFDFWKVHWIMNTLGLLQSKWRLKGFMLTLQETWSIHDSMNIQKI